MSYYSQTNYISNSELTVFRDRMQLRKERDLTKVFRFGSLFDAMVTEEKNVNYFTNRLIEGNVEIEFEKREFETALLMKQAGEADSTLKAFMDTASKQHEFYRNKFVVNWEGIEARIPVRCKLDFLAKRIKTGADLKSTACTSSKSFHKAIFDFDYDRQAAWYMDIAELDRFMIIGVSKTAHRRTGLHGVYKYVITKGDKTYLEGKKKYSYLATKYFYLIHNF